MLVKPFGFLGAGKIPPLIYVGMQYGGGSVGALYGTYPNQYGTIVANEDTGIDYSWGNNFSVTTYAAYGSGSVNQTNILASDATAPAALYCSNYSGSGFTDWVLPSQTDLVDVRPNNDLLLVPFVTIGGSSLYWSSYATVFNLAWAVDFNPTTPYINGITNAFRCCGPSSPGPGLKVRPVRYFDFR